MSAIVIQFPKSHRLIESTSDVLDMLADRLTANIANLPDTEDDTLMLLRSIDSKLTNLIKSIEVQHG